MPFDWGQCQIPHPSPGPKGWGFQLTGALFLITQCHCQKGGVSVGVKINGSSKPSGVMVTPEIWEDPRPILRYKTGLQNHKETHKNET